LSVLPLRKGLKQPFFTTESQLASTLRLLKPKILYHA
jgi:hypothetical protein